jgi:type I restriction enzyme S subunit
VGLTVVIEKSLPQTVYSGFLIRFRPEPEQFEKPFLRYCFYNEEFRREVISKSTVSANANINQVSLGQLEVALPPPPQQRRIATILSTMDEVIEATEKLVEKHQQIKAGLMHDLFTRGLWTRPELARGDHHGLPCEATAQEGQLRPTPEEAPRLYQDSPLGPIPKVWEAASLLSISNSMTNGFVGTATPYYSEDEDAVQYLYGNNVRADKLELPSSMRVTRRFHELQRKSQLQPGDMLTVQSGHIGTSAIVPESLGEANCHALIITKFRTSRVVPDFVSYYCNSPGGYQRLGSIFVGSTILHINVKEFKNFAIPLPQDLREQERICERLVAINERLDAENTHLAKLRQQKQGLMHDLLTGRVRVDRC